MDKLCLGKIVNTHGIKGEVRVQSLTNQPEERYQVGHMIYIGDEKGHFLPVTVQRYRQHKNFDLLTFAEFQNINDVEQFINQSLWIDVDDVNELDQNEYYVHEIVGYAVKSDNQQFVGHLKEILSFPANDVWVVERESKDDLLLPGTHEVILNVNHSDKEITVHILEGLDSHDED